MRHVRSMNDLPQLLARAFHQDPFLAWAEPDVCRRPRTLARLFQATLEFSRTTGASIVEPGIGVVEWRPPKYAQMSWGALFRSGAWRLGLTTPWSVCARLMKHEDFAMARVQRRLGADAAYIGCAGVEPSLAGQGHGSRLLQRAVSSLGERFEACFLRTEQPKNVRFYERNGFELVDDFIVPVSGLRTWVFRHQR